MGRMFAMFVFLGSLAMTGQEVAPAQEGVSDSAPRTWTSCAGGYTTKATLLKFKDGVVQLQRQDGSVVSVAIEKLSEADQEFVRQRVPSASGGGNPFSGSGERHGPMSEVERASTALCEQIDKSYRGKGIAAKPRIAVVEFSDLSGKVTDLGRILSEELTTKLFSTGKYSVVERFLLNKAIAEHKLQLQGIVDPKSAKELGKILGVDAVVSGTMGSVGDTTRVNARVISTETGEIFSVAAVNIPKEALGSRMDSSSVPESSATEKGQLVFHEDFSGDDEGDLPDWGHGVRVQLGRDGRKWLAASKEGVFHVGKKVSFPDDAWYLEFSFTAHVRTESRYEGEGLATSSISLIDEEGKRYRIGWQIYARKHVFTLPDGTTQDFGSGTTLREATRGSAPSPPSPPAYTLKGRTLRMAKNGDVLRLFIDGKVVLSGDVKGFGKFAGFEVDVYAAYGPLGPFLIGTIPPKGNSIEEYINFTNFKVGRLQ